jgi:hypothetical protein
MLTHRNGAVALAIVARALAQGDCLRTLVRLTRLLTNRNRIDLLTRLTSVVANANRVVGKVNAANDLSK